uniref:Secreted protein n=1 Tax=Trichogramma kaykai TaxID=54128 RepID=A0ABD2WLZ7_9HYME
MRLGAREFCWYVCVCMSQLRLGRAGNACCECERERTSRAAPRGAPACAQRLSSDHVEVSQERRFASSAARAAASDHERRESAEIERADRHSSPSSSSENISSHSDDR